MRRIAFLLILSICLVPITLSAADRPLPITGGTLIFEDDFERVEDDNSKEQVGNGWGTNSKSRAQGVKQVDLDQGAMHITMAKVADHGVSVTQDIAFKNAVIQMRFKLGPNHDLGINIADMKEKSVHAGHICMTRIRPNKVEITDLKTGRMNLETRTRNQAKQLTTAEKKALNQKTKTFPVKLKPNVWHDLEITIQDDRFAVRINGKSVGEFHSPGIAHDTKSRIRLAVNSDAWVDDIKVYQLAE